MGVDGISAASLSQDVFSASNSDQLQQTLQTLQNSISSGNLSGAETAFGALQQLNQHLETASGSSSASNSQLSTDLTALGSAIGSGDLSTAQSALATVKNDLKDSSSPSRLNETNAALQSEQLVSELLSTLNVNSSSSSASDTTSVLQRVYGSPGSLNVLG
ncbi:MAG: hypothetical protein ACLPHI_03695 [Terriglobales bacterium]|jgi:hypothetical protein